MNATSIYILISVLALAGIMAALILTRKKMGQPLTKLAALAFLFVMMGILFSEPRFFGYTLIGVGLILAAIDIIKKFNK